MKRHEFKIVMAGYGDNTDEAWEDATDSFALDPGPIPEDYEVEDEQDRR